MGFWKTMTDATMTTTRLMQLPMEWVTGVTWRSSVRMCDVGVSNACVEGGVGWTEQGQEWFRRRQEGGVQGGVQGGEQAAPEARAQTQGQARDARAQARGRPHL